MTFRIALLAAAIMITPLTVMAAEEVEATEEKTEQEAAPENQASSEPAASAEPGEEPASDSGPAAKPDAEPAGNDETEKVAKKIVVLEPANGAGLSHEQISEIADRLKNTLSENGAELIDYETVVNRADAEGISLTDCNDVACELKLGNALGGGVISGRIGRFGDDYHFVLKKVCPATGNVRLLVEQICPDLDCLKDASSQAGYVALGLAPGDLSAVGGDRIGAASYPGDSTEGTPELTLGERYLGFFDRMLNEIGELDIYGNSGQLPKGLFSIKYNWNWMETAERFQATGKRGRVIEPLSIGEDISIDLDGAGWGMGHTFQMSYGVNNPFDLYMELPFQEAHVRLRPKYRGPEEGDQLAFLLSKADMDISNYKGFCSALYQLGGRPCPSESYDSDGWELGDIHGGFSWNFHHSEEFSAALTQRIFFPTARLADPNESLFFALGPQIDAGNRAWALGQTFNFDYRPWWLYKWATFMMEFTWQYSFPTKRKHPTIFGKPLTMGELPEEIDPWIQLACGLADPSTDPDLFLACQTMTDDSPVIGFLGQEVLNYFPDLSNLDGEYTYSIGWAIDGAVGVAIDLKVATLVIQYGFGMSQDPKIESSYPEFVAMVKSLEMLGYEDQESLGIGLMTPVLLAAYVPLYISIQTEIPQSGRNSLIFYDKKMGDFSGNFWDGFSNGNLTVGLQLFLPFNTDF